MGRSVWNRTQAGRAATMLVVCGVVAGCAKPTPDRPWSTKSASALGADAAGVAVEPPVLVMPVEPAVVVSAETDRTPAETSVAVIVDADDTNESVAEDVARADSGDSPEVTTVQETVVVAEPDPAPRPAPILRGATPAERAARVVAIAAESENALERAYAYEAMQHAPDLLLEYGPRGIVDENRGVRFVATMAIGRAMVGRLAPLLHPGLLDDSESVRAATIYSLRSLGEGVDPSPLAAMVASDDPEVRGNATMVLGMLGNASAIPLIENSLGKGMRLRNPMRVRITELQAAEALVSLGQEEDVEPIRAALFAPVEQGELTVLACDMLGRLEDEQARPMLMRLLLAEGNQRRPPEIRVAAAGAIFRLPPPWESGLEQVLLEQAGAEDPRLRVQVAAALRGVPGEGSGKALDRMLADADPVVRIAAAGALLGRQVDFPPTTAAVSD